MDPETRQRVEKNLFEGARKAVEPWDEFKWHLNRSGICDTGQPNSSQALAIDVFGTLKTATQEERDAVFGELCTRLRLTGLGPWDVHLEWEDEQNRLRERRRSQIDALAESNSAIILFECKFGEIDSGSCSQPHSQPLRQCNGNYELQENPVNGKTARCTLTGKGIRYWDVIPSIFRLETEEDHTPCPFEGSWFQLMRNLVLAEEMRRIKNCQSSFVIVYADHPNLAFSRKLSSPEWREFKHALRSDADAPHTISYQELLAIAVRATEPNNTKWRDLETWVDKKIHALGSRSEA